MKRFLFAIAMCLSVSSHAASVSGSFTAKLTIENRSACEVKMDSDIADVRKRVVCDSTQPFKVEKQGSLLTVEF